MIKAHKEWVDVSFSSEAERRQLIDSVYARFREEYFEYTVRRMQGNKNLAEEALQETLVRAWKKQDEFMFTKGVNGLYAWLLGTLKFVCNSMRRAMNRENNGYTEDIEYLNEAVTMAHEKPSDQEQVLDAMEYDEHRERMVEIIAESQLTNLEWAVVTAIRLGFSHTQIAKEMKMSTHAVSAHLSNAMPRLRETMASNAVAA